MRREIVVVVVVGKRMRLATITAGVGEQDKKRRRVLFDAAGMFSLEKL